MRGGWVRRVFGVHGWGAGGQLPGAGGPAPGIECSDNRRTGCRCARASRAGRVSGIRRCAVRHLHAWHDSGRGASIERKSRADDGRHPRSTGGKFVPLHGIPADSRSGGRGSREARGGSMRSDPAEFQLVTPSDLQSALALMTAEGELWMPIAGGTDLMVQYAAGVLRARRLMSIARLPELRHIDVGAHEIRIGAGSTYTDLRRHETIARGIRYRRYWLMERN